MVLAVVDDLMFTSKIRAAAKGVGATVSFARSREATLAAVREQQPSLVVFDLDNPRTDPVGTIAALKADVATQAARAAGADDVLARSAFTQRLPELLAP